MSGMMSILHGHRFHCIIHVYDLLEHLPLSDLLKYVGLDSLKVCSSIPDVAEISITWF